MNGRSCQSPLSWETLIAYWLGELDPADEARAEEHYLGCPQCSHRLEQLAALAHGVRAVARQSGVPMIVNDQFVHRLSEDGLRVREYRVPRNGSVNCTVAPDDDFVVGRLEAPLKGAQRVDLVTLDSDGNIQMRQQDVPFVAESGGVVFSPSIAMLRGLSVATLRVRLLAVDADGEHTLGDYTFNHTPYTSENPQ
jgi:hypothetical protein